MRKLATLLAPVALIGAMMLPATTIGRTTSPVRRATQNQNQRRRGRPENHAELDGALRALQRAKAGLEHASHDFGGHRVKALDLTNQAIDEVKQALASDQQ